MYYHTIYDETTKTWSGLKTLPTYNPNVSAAQVILNTLKMNSNKIGQVIRPDDPKKSVKFSILNATFHILKKIII